MAIFLRNDNSETFAVLTTIPVGQTHIGNTSLLTLRMTKVEETHFFGCPLVMLFVLFHTYIYRGWNIGNCQLNWQLSKLVDIPNSVNGLHHDWIMETTAEFKDSERPILDLTHLLYKYNQTGVLKRRRFHPHLIIFHEQSQHWSEAALCGVWSRSILYVK